MSELQNTHNVDDIGMPEALEGDVTTEEQEGQELEAQTPATEPIEEQPEPAQQQASQPDFTRRELEWLRSTVQKQNEQMSRLQKELEEYELAGLDPEEAAQKRIQRLEQELQQREQAQMANQARQEWRQYYKQFNVPDELLEGDDPITWQHNTLSHLQKQAADALDQVAALKKVQDTPKAPKVTSKPGSGANKRTVWDYSFEEIETMADEIRFGQRDPGDIPPMQ